MCFHSFFENAITFAVSEGFTLGKVPTKARKRSGEVCEYLAEIDNVLCPNNAAISGSEAPFASNREAKICLKSWNRRSPRPTRRTARLKAFDKSSTGIGFPFLVTT
jgi:hypothetical protein